MNYQSTPRSNRPKGFMVKHWLQFALFVAFSLWLLYQIRQPAGTGGPAGPLSTTDHISNIIGRKGSAGLPKSTLDLHPGLTLVDTTNPVEEGEIRKYSKELEAAEFHTMAGSLGNDNNTLSRGLIGQTKDKKSNISFPDENGIPQHVRDKFIGVESKKVNDKVNNMRAKSQSQSQSLITTRVSNRRNGSIKES